VEYLWGFDGLVGTVQK